MTTMRFGVVAMMAAGLVVPAVVCGQTPTPTPVLVVQREMTKPGKGGDLHEKSEAAFKAAAVAGKAPYHYVAAVSLSGPDRADFLSWYPSFAAWAAENAEMSKKPALGAALDHAMVSDGDLLSATEQSVWVLDADKSYNMKNPGMFHYLEVESFKIKPGHGAQWDESVKLVKAAYMKSLPEAHWAMYRLMYGGGDEYVVLIGLKSLADVDRNITDGPKFAAAMGEDGMKKLDGLMSACVAEENTDLFRLSPKMSIVSDEWAKEDPEFWMPKAAPAKKASEKK
jgi:hypothetical protein